MKRFIAILIALALAAAALTSCAGAPGIDFSSKGRGEDALGEPNEKVPPLSEEDREVSPEEQDNAAAPDGDTASAASEPAETEQSQSQKEVDQKETEPIETDPAEPEPKDPKRALLDSINASTASAMGLCGASLAWYFKDGVLAVKGSGEMTDYSKEFEESTAPWTMHNGGELKYRITHLIIEDGVTTIGTYAFSSLSNLVEAEIPESVAEIRYRAFEDCTSLSSVDLTDSLKKIWGSAFDNCRSLKSVHIPASVEDLDYACFEGCTDTVFYLPDGITSIDLCESLINTGPVVIPASVTRVDSFGFQREIYFLGDAPEIETCEVIYDRTGDPVETAFCGLFDGYKEDFAWCSASDEPIEDGGITIFYSGKGFDEYIEMFPKYHWVKK